jgi:prepilin-type N-terminal cleavage/methylation domain-containing protein
MAVRPARSRRRPPRGGFTLVELMMVILIIALLMGLVTAVYFGVYVKGQTTKVVVELDGLATAIEHYKQDRKAYPPSFAAYDGGLLSEGLVVRHVSAAFPRYNAGGTTAGDGDGAAEGWDDLAADVFAGTVGAQNPDAPGYDVADGLDLNTLDQAEALVFWLAGLPSRTEESKTIGFSLNPLNPFESGIVQPANRTPRLFQFEPGRLVDRDLDGWWEYVPDMRTTSGETPPFVYFDSTTYNVWDGDMTADAFGVAPYPSSAMGAVRGPAGTGGAPNLLATWGQAWPWLRLPYDTMAMPPVARNQWLNSDTFQIVCSGLDGVYDDPALPIPAPPQWHESLHALDPDHPVKDNLTNFAEGPLAEQDEREHLNEGP